jgi:hypothetical protein
MHSEKDIQPWSPLKKNSYVVELSLPSTADSQKDFFTLGLQVVQPLAR